MSIDWTGETRTVVNKPDGRQIMLKATWKSVFIEEYTQQNVRDGIYLTWEQVSEILDEMEGDE